MLAAESVDLKHISDGFEESSPQEILRWAVDRYHPRLTMATAFGAEGCVIISMLAEIEPDVKIYNLETGYQFAETLEMRERINARYGIEVEYIHADETVAAMESRFGGPIYNSHPDECCRIRKIVPLRRAVAGYSAWISAIRRDQTAHRAQSAIVDWDRKFDLVKINPLANWTKRDVWSYIMKHDVPYNPLHDQGFPSIGCRPCTHPSNQGDDDRSGRWLGSLKTECGLHTH